MATIGVEQHTFRITVPGLNGRGTIGKRSQTIIGTMHGEAIFRKIKLIGRVWVGTIWVEQHTFRTTVFGFQWAGHHWKTKTNHHWQHTWGTKFPKIKLIGVFGGDDWG